jgi:hypothetical protein
VPFVSRVLFPNKYAHTMKGLCTLIVYLILLGTLNLGAQCSGLRADLKHLFNSSDLVIEAKIVSKASFFDPSEQFIYTRYLLKPYKSFKGSVVPELELISLGGTLENEAMVVSGTMDAEVGMAGVFMVQDYRGNNARPTRNNRLFIPVAGGQSVISYRPDWGVAYRIDDTYSSLQDLYGQLENLAGRKAIDIAVPEVSVSRNPTAFITNIEPEACSAGTGDTVTITGEGFGDIPGTVFFSNADNGGMGYTSTSHWHIVSWNNHTIRVRVPHKAGSGDLIVLGSTGVAFSSEELRVNFAHTNILSSGIFHQPQLINDNGTESGYRFSLSDSEAHNGVPFMEAEGAYEALERAVAAWQDSVQAPLYISKHCPPTSHQAPSAFDDGVNLITFDNDLWDLDVEVSAYTLAVAISRYARCEGTDWEVVDVDIIVRRDGDPNDIGGAVDWSFDEEGVGEYQIDFQSVMVHELGHALQLQHVVEEAAVMHYSTSYGQVKRALGAEDDQQGANFVLGHSLAYEPAQLNCWPAQHFASARKLSLYHENHDCKADTIQNNFSFPVALEESEMRLYPNPIQEGELTIAFHAGQSSAGQITVMGMDGKVYQNLSIHIAAGQNNLTMQLAELARGVYVLQVSYAGHQVNRRLIKA